MELGEAEVIIAKSAHMADRDVFSCHAAAINVKGTWTDGCRAWILWATAAGLRRVAKRTADKDFKAACE